MQIGADLLRVKVCFRGDEWMFTVWGEGVKELRS